MAQHTNPTRNLFGERTFAPCKFHKNSRRGPTTWQKIGRDRGESAREAKRFWRNAQRRNAAHGPREYGGALGPAALLIYNLLVFKYYNLETGRCDPSLERMAADSGYSRASVAEAIAELERRGMIRHHRRVYQKETRPGARWEYAQDTNAYTLVKPERWRGYTVAPPRTPPVDGDTVGAPEPVEDTRTPEDKAGDDAAGIAAQAKQTLEIWAPAAEGSSADLARALLSAARTRLEQLRTKER